MLAVLEEAKDLGARKLSLRVHEENETARSLYKTLGFVEEGRLKMEAKNRKGDRYMDMIIMAFFC